MINPKARPCAEATIRSTPAARNCAADAKPWVLLATILASSIAYVDESVVNIALPAIETDLATSVAVIQWLVNAYALCLSAFLLTGGAAGDLFGRRRIFVIGVAVFAAASLWCGFSLNVTQLILARAIQGAGAALLIPCSLAIIGATFEEFERGKAIGTWAGFSAIAAAIGPLSGGWIVDHFTWRWIFLINPVLALPTLWIFPRVGMSEPRAAWIGVARSSHLLPWAVWHFGSSQRRSWAGAMRSSLPHCWRAYCCCRRSFGKKAATALRCCRWAYFDPAHSAP